MRFMAFIAPPADTDRPEGPTYCGILAVVPRADLVQTLTAVRFSGYVGPQEGPWVVTVCLRPRGAVAGKGMTAAQVARAVSAALGTVTFTVLVHRDLMLSIEAFLAGEPVLTYCSDPTVADPSDEELLPEPVGAQEAPAFAAALGDPGVATELEELLGEELGESENESERVTRVLRLIGAPAWIVAAETLPKKVPSGPGAKEFTRLRAGKAGVPGRVDGAVREIVRRKS